MTRLKWWMKAVGVLYPANAVMMAGANPTADCYVCDRCGYIHWFLPRR